MPSVPPVKFGLIILYEICGVSDINQDLLVFSLPPAKNVRTHQDRTFLLRAQPAEVPKYHDAVADLWSVSRQSTRGWRVYLQLALLRDFEAGVEGCSDEAMDAEYDAPGQTQCATCPCCGPVRAP